MLKVNPFIKIRSCQDKYYEDHFHRWNTEAIEPVQDHVMHQEPGRESGQVIVEDWCGMKLR